MATGRMHLLQVALTVAICTTVVLSDVRFDPPPEVFRMYQSSHPHIDLKEIPGSLSPQCKAEIGKLIQSPETLASDAVMALDAFGKPPAGLLAFNLAWLGHYDECRSIPGFNYCLAELSLNISMVMQTLSTLFNSSSDPKTFGFGKIQWGICPPSNCSDMDVLFVLKDLLDALKVLDKFGIPTEAISAAYAVCTKTPTIPYSAGVICTIVLCSVIALLMIIGALYDETMKLLARKPLLEWLGFKDMFRLLDDTHHDSDSDDVPMLRDVGTGSSGNTTAQPKKENLFVRVLMCFALNRNLAKLMDTKQGDKTIGALNGIRVISMTWVMLGHTMGMGLASLTVDNMKTLQDWAKTHPGFQAIANAFFSVDTFFFLSGFLLAYLTLGRFNEMKGIKKWFMFYFHRYWRLTPLFGFIILIWMYVSPFVGEGPLWQMYSARPNCPKYWWSSLLYIGNFWPTDFSKQCISWSWYLANDMQFFIISPLFLVPLYYFPLIGWLILIGTLLLSFLATGLVIGLYNLDMNFLDFTAGFTTNNSFSLVYEKPYCRIAPYLVGIGLGYIMHKTGNRKVKMSPIVALLGWIFAAALALTVVYSLYPDVGQPITGAPAILYGTISRFAWSLSLAWVVYACKYGYGGWVNSFLSWNAWIPLGRVTYSAYLVHPIVILVIYFNYANTWHFSVYLLAFYFAGFVALSYAAAIVLSLAIEYPFANLEKVMFPSSSKANKETSRNHLEAGVNPTLSVNAPPSASPLAPNGEVETGRPAHEKVAAED